MSFTNRVRLFVENIDEEAREELLQQILQRQDGVELVEVQPGFRTALVAGRMLDLEAIRSAVEVAGFSLVSMIRSAEPV
jgi:hypothetical protein